MMSNTPRVFVGTTTFLIAGMTSRIDLQNSYQSDQRLPLDPSGRCRPKWAGHGDRRPPGECTT